MNPDTTSPEYQRARAVDQMHAEADRDRRAGLHARAVARRRKAKRGGKR
jgi:hypothetical protein